MQARYLRCGGPHPSKKKGGPLRDGTAQNEPQLPHHQQWTYSAGFLVVAGTGAATEDRVKGRDGAQGVTKYLPVV